MKRIVSLILAFVLVLPCVAVVPAVAAEGQGVVLTYKEVTEHKGEGAVLLEQVPQKDGATTADGLEYTITDGEVTITDYTGSATELLIPDTIEGYPVTAIGEYAFSYSRTLSCITLPESLIRIEAYAFDHCPLLTSITIPEGVTSLGKGAFSYCPELAEIFLPESLTHIGEYAFEGCYELTGIDFPANVRSIGAAAFYLCDNLARITWPEGVETIGENTFFLCQHLTEITLPKTLVGIQESAFTGCDRLSDVYYEGTEVKWKEIKVESFNECLLNAAIHYTEEVIPEGLEYTITDGEVTITGYTGSATELLIPEFIEGYPVTAIGHYAFSYCSDLRFVQLPKGLKKIGFAAFAECVSLSGLPLPEGLTQIEDSAFYHCESLTAIEIPRQIQSIGNSVFSNCIRLAEVILPVGLTRIDDYAFSHCESLGAIEIPETVTRIGVTAFSKCSSLTELRLPSGLQAISSWMLQGCSALVSVEIPSSITEIGEYAFFSCPSLCDVYYGGSKAQWGQMVIGEKNTSLTSATVHYHYGRDHSYDDAADQTCNECDYVREVPDGSDGKVILRCDADEVFVGRPFDVYVELKEIKQAVGSVDLHLLLSDNLQYVSSQILVNPSEFLMYAFLPEEMYFGCGMTINGVTGDYPLLKLTLVATAEGTAEVTPAMDGVGQGVGNLVGNGKLDVAGESLSLPAVIHVCVFDREVAEERYLKSAATCTEAAWYYKSCECGERGEEVFSFGLALGHSYGDWLTDGDKHWHLCEVCQRVIDEAEHSYDDFWDAECNVCGRFRPRPLIGDANEDGEVNFSDIQRIYSHRTTENKLTGDALVIADANKDGQITFSDIQRIYQHLSTPNKLF